MIENREDAAAMKEADDHLLHHIIPMGWELIEIGQMESVILHRAARKAVVQRGGLELVIVWDRGLKRFLCTTDIEGTRWGIFDPALYFTDDIGAAARELANTGGADGQALVDGLKPSVQG